MIPGFLMMKTSWHDLDFLIWEGLKRVFYVTGNGLAVWRDREDREGTVGHGKARHGRAERGAVRITNQIQNKKIRLEEGEREGGR